MTKKMNKRLSGSILILAMSLLMFLLFCSFLITQWALLGSKITANQLDSYNSFNAAEEALIYIENNVINNVNIEKFNNNGFDGFYFSGDNKELPQLCKTSTATPWNNAKYWKSSRYHQKLVLNYGMQSTLAKYIVEFLCYMPQDIEGPEIDYTRVEDIAMVFRITVLGISANGAESMVQSTYKKNLL